jgi:putative membrane protein
MMWYWGSGMHWWVWLLGSVAMVVVWGVVIWAIWYFVTSVARRPEPPRDGDPKRILDERLARGEIDVDEYRRLREVIRGDEVQAANGTALVKSGGPR